MKNFDDALAESRSGIDRSRGVAESGATPSVLVASIAARGQRHHRRRIEAMSAVGVVAVLLIGAAAFARGGGPTSDSLDVGGQATSTIASVDDSTITGTSTSLPGATTNSTDPVDTTESTTDPSVTDPTATVPVVPSTTPRVSAPRASVPPTSAPVTSQVGPPQVTAPTTPVPPVSTTARVPVNLDPLPGVPTDPRAAYARWKANAPARYTMRLSGPAVGSRALDVTVEGTGLSSEVVAAVDVATGAPVAVAGVSTIDVLYDLMVGEFGSCSCLTVSVGSGLSVDGVPSELRVTTNDGSSTIFYSSISAFAAG